jgi:predicted amidohydrolase
MKLVNYLSPCLLQCLLRSALVKAIALLTLSVTALAASKLEPIQEIIEPPAPPNDINYAKVAVVQWAPFRPAPLSVSSEQAEAFKAENRRTLENYIREAAAHGAKLVITPEFAVVGYPDIPELPDEEDEFRTRSDVQPYTEPAPGPTTQFFSQLARELGIYIHVGFAEVDLQTDTYYNTVVALSPEGKIVARYRKINLFKQEKKFLSPGKDPAMYLSPFGKIGILICADVYSFFPMQAYQKAGVDVLALSTSWAQYNTGMEMFRRSAASTRSYLLAANQTYFPDSGVINPDGSLQSHIRQSMGLAYGYLPLKNSH